MAEEKPERPYPVRSLHDFLTELNKEWDKFRTGSLIGMITSGALLVFFVLRLLLGAIRRMDVGDVGDVVFFLFIAALLVYSIFALLAQYRFFKRWERRVGLLLHLEEELIGEKLGESTPK